MLGEVPGGASLPFAKRGGREQAERRSQGVPRAGWTGFPRSQGKCPGPAPYSDTGDKGGIHPLSLDGRGLG